MIGCRVADGERGDALAQPLDEDVVEGRFNDGAGAGRALLSAESEGRSDDALDRGVEIGISADQDGVFAAHFENGALDPDLAGLGLCGALVNLEADGLGAGESDEARFGMLHNGVAESRAGAGAEVDHAVGHAGLFKHFDKSARRWWANRSTA